MKKQAVFSGLYASYYDLMYAGKEYDRETKYVLRALREKGHKRCRLLSLGAGTLAYELRLAKKGWEIDAIDFAPDMVAVAKGKLRKAKVRNVKVSVGDMRRLPERSRKYDAVVALFNVLAYCRNLSEVEAVFKGASRNLSIGGVFLFDCWNLDAVKKDPPQSRLRKFRTRSSELYRITTTRPRGNAIDLEIELIAFEKGKFVGREIESHTVRAWSPKDLSRVGKKYGMKIAHTSVFPEWKKKINAKDWAMAMVFMRE